MFTRLRILLTDGDAIKAEFSKKAEVNKMRKEAKTERRANITNCEMYHGTRCVGARQANSFINGANYYASDRAKELSSVPTPKGYGIEWEMTSTLRADSRALATILNAEFTAHLPKNFFKFEEDCTVDVECISQIGTKAFFRNHYSGFKAIYKYLNAVHIGPNYGDSNCGMHINISIANFGKDIVSQEANIMKIHNWINESTDSYRFACRMLHRDVNHTEWCGKMRPNYLDACGSHNYCMNYSHMDEGEASRVEIRLVGAQRTFGNWRNTMEVVFWLVKQSKELSARDWRNPIKLWSGCNQYVYDRLKDCMTDAHILESIRHTVVEEDLV